MVLNLERFQAESPYPQVRAVRPDSALAAKLRDGYSGKASELTTVTQYAYHSLQCREQYADISRVIRGIFYVETLHLELLGDCIAKLGGDVRYNVGTSQADCWQASLVHYETVPAAILRADIQGEKYAADFYRETARLCDQPEIARLLMRLAEDEILHYRIFSDLYGRFSTGPVKPEYPDRAFRTHTIGRNNRFD